MRGATNEKSHKPSRSENALATRDVNRSPLVREKTTNAPGTAHALFGPSNEGTVTRIKQDTSLYNGPPTIVKNPEHIAELHGHSLDWNDFGRREPAPGM